MVSSGAQYVDKQFNYGKTLPNPSCAAKEKGTGELPGELSTPEAMALWKKAMSKGWIDERYQPKLSLTKSAIFAFEMANRLGIQERWKVFEQFWNRKNMRSNYNNALLQRQSLIFQDEVKALFSGTLD